MNIKKIFKDIFYKKDNELSQIAKEAIFNAKQALADSYHPKTVILNRSLNDCNDKSKESNDDIKKEENIDFLYFMNSQNN